ncbi:MAG: Zn-dependent oligopeptidase [Candidatus Eisenbacteria bacterium]|uniref:Zn-dependent oligopeptidase n=1 Tax=Eiseniibacteriota bacterium TaxID=2212470 RepID=A0A849SHP4_UNCEI|nr:Zn-dependent oligopeptidase [Candidatus Eisenbacteria bacterium]
MARAKVQIAKMVAAKGKRTIENTLVPYDEASRELDMAGSITSLMENVHPDSNVRTAAEALTQKVAAYGTEISLDRKVYDALVALDLSGVDAETRFYVERELRDFRLAGVDKDEATRGKIKTLRDELVKVGQEFDRNIRDDVRTIKVKPEQLSGLPADFVSSHKPGDDGMITLDINYPDYVPTMTYCTNDEVRKHLYLEFQNRAYPKNMTVLKQLIEKRHTLANLLGYSNWADYITANKMVGTSQNVRDFIDRIVAASGSAQERDFQILLRRKKTDDPTATTIPFWQTSFYNEAVKRSDYNFDSQSIRPYLSYPNVIQGVLDVSSRLFGVTFKRVENVKAWDASVEAYEMWKGDDLVGRFYLDMHPRPNKYNHAAQFDIRTGLAGRQLPEAALVCNLPGGEAGDPGLCEIDDVNTVFHEFGHLLHTLFAGHRKWVGTAGIRTEHDFVEAPSQMLEEWMKDPKVLQTFAKHHETGEPVPTDLVVRMKRAEEYGKGLQVRRQMVYADLSLSIYDRDPAKVDIDALMKTLVTRYQPFQYLDDTHFACSFGHLDGYSAVYYTYMWSLVIAKDMFSAFNHSDLLDPTVSTRYRDAVLAAGGSKPAAKMVEDFLGRPYNFEAYRAWLNEMP